MWVGEVIDVNDLVIQRVYLKLGKKVKVGRSSDNGIYFPSDKSISRLHAEISVISGAVIHVVDLKARYGTSIGDEKLQPEQEYVLEPGSVVKFGAVNSRVRFIRQQLNFCVTRLEKAEKDRLKKNSKSIGGKIVQVAEIATHLVTNKFTATVKLLVAIVLKKKIVTDNWLITFTESEDPSQIIPKEEDFAPTVEESCEVADLSLSRATLCENIVVFLLNEDDIQYDIILTTCGATVIRLFATGSVISAQVIQTHAKQYYKQQVCIFFDESKGTAAPRHLTPDGSVQWLVVEQLAKAVMTCKPPVLSAEPPAQLRGSASQQIPQYTTQRHTQQTMGTPSQTPLNSQIPTATKTVGGWTQPFSQVALGDVSPAAARAAPSVFSTLIGGSKQQPTAPVIDKPLVSNTAVQSMPPPILPVAPVPVPVPAAVVAAAVPKKTAKRSFLDMALDDSDDDEVVVVKPPVVETKSAVSATVVSKSIEGGAVDVVENPTKKVRREDDVTVQPPKQASPPPKVVPDVSAASSKKGKLNTKGSDLQGSQSIQSFFAPVTAPTVTNLELITPAKVNTTTATTMATPVVSTVTQQRVNDAVLEEVESPTKRPRRLPPSVSTTKSTVTASTCVDSRKATGSAFLQTSTKDTDNIEIEDEVVHVTTNNSNSSSSSSSGVNNNKGKEKTIKTITKTTVAAQPVVIDQDRYVLDTFDPSVDNDEQSAVAVDAQCDAENWFPILRGMSRMTVLQTKQHAQEEHKEALALQHQQRHKLSAHLRPSATSQAMQDFDHDQGAARGADDEEQDEEDFSNAYTQPVVVERALLMRGRRLVQTANNAVNVANGRVNNTNSNSSSGTPAITAVNIRNVKRFVKNFVRQVQAEDVMASRYMDRVLPKESERELQLRLEAEAVKAREEYAEQMFSDRFQDGGGGGAAVRGRVRR